MMLAENSVCRHIGGLMAFVIPTGRAFFAVMLVAMHCCPCLAITRPSDYTKAESDLW